MKARAKTSASTRVRGTAALQKRLRQAERRLRELERLHEIVMGAVNESVYDWDIARDRIFYSVRMERALGLPPAALQKPRDWWDRIHPDDLERYRTTLVAHFKGEAPRFECDFRYRAHDGSWRWARQHGLAMRNRKGTAVRMVGSTGDITELKERERQLAEQSAILGKSEERYALATSAAVEGIYEWDIAAGTLFLTERAKEFFAIEGDVLTPAAWNERVHSNDYPGYKAAIADHFRGRARILEHEYRIADAKGTYKWVLDRGVGVRDTAGRVTKVVGALSDITQRKEAEIGLRRALEQQVATSDILRVISRSPTDAQPVFDIIGERAEKLCGAEISIVSIVDGDKIRLVALHGENPEGTATIRRYFPMPLTAETVTARTVRTSAAVNVPDVLADPAYETRDAALGGGFRGSLGVPMLREGHVIGVIFVSRRMPGRFNDSQVELLKTFADQAVIAIENVRLFTELETRTAELLKSVDKLKALGEVGQAVSSTLDLETVLSTIVSRAAHLTGMDGGAIFEYDEAREAFHLRATDRMPDELVGVLGAAPIPKGEGAVGGLALTGEPVQVRDIADEASYRSRVREILVRRGYRSLLAVPLLREDHLLGGLVVNRKQAGEFAPEVIDLLRAFATQSALAIQNARLYREIEVKSRELETASRHKSEFLANMSHELRTPLNAIIGFSEVLAERMFGEINDKQSEYLRDILESGRHLLSLINDILDLSKIEAGRMELEPSEFDLPGVIENALILVRERANRHGIALERDVDARLGRIRADERKVKQVLLNLLTNALKFTPEGGRIEVRARVHDGAAEISVADTGVGIAPQDQAAVFEEFRQVGTASKKIEGTGLGLAISRKFVELHGGRIWVTSEVGAGSTFAFTLPLATPARQG